MRLHYLTTISTTCGAINTPAPLKEFYVVVNSDIIFDDNIDNLRGNQCPCPAQGILYGCQQGYIFDDSIDNLRGNQYPCPAQGILCSCQQGYGMRKNACK